MIIATHQPIFLPWPGLFFKALEADCMVLLDEVQYPQGRGWVNRNRIKNKDGEMWLRVPVWKKGRGLQLIRNVEICDETDWRKKHLQSILHNYSDAPYLMEYFPGLEELYMKNHQYLVDLNLSFIKFIFGILGIKTKMHLQSELGVRGKGFELIISICRHLGAGTYLNFQVVEKYLNVDRFHESGINVYFPSFNPPVYPQLWGEFIHNLSILDMILNCGEISREIISSSK